MPDILITPNAPSSAITGLQDGCLTCGANICQRGFVNFPSTVANDAKVVCIDCFLDMSRQVGCLNPEQGQDLRQRLADAQTTISQMQTEIDGHLEIQNAFKKIEGLRVSVVPV